MENEYVSSEIAARIKFMAKQKNVTVGAMLEAIELGKNTMTNFKTSMPKAVNLAKSADYLDCSVDYLLGRTDNPEFGTPTLQNSGNHIAFGNSCQNNSIAIGDIARDVSSDTEELEQEICSILKRLPLRKRTELLTIMYHYVDENEEKEGE